MKRLPLGKLSPDLLASLLERYAQSDPRLLLGPGVGLDCAVLDFGDRLLVTKSDPITFTADEIGWYAVHVNANDIVTTGAKPRWFMATLLLPEDTSDEALVTSIFDQIDRACKFIGAMVIGGHTEITAGLDRPILAGTMFGEIEPDRLITPRGARPGDQILLTKGVPIEATSILGREFSQRLTNLLPETLNRARDYLHDPGISVVPEALAAADAGGVTAMHDPTEGGLAAGLWEMAEAAHVGLSIDHNAIPVPPEAFEICSALDIDPLEAIASGALLITVNPESIDRVCSAIEELGIVVSVIGQVAEGRNVAMRSGGVEKPLPWPHQDALARLFENTPTNT
jgi:hydrogenase expression/formation protein HypE